MNTHTNIVFQVVATAMAALSVWMPTTVIAADRLDDDPSAVLSDTQWRELDDAVDRALHWIASQQQPDGSFRAPDAGQPGITSLCVLAYLSRGHLPGEGPYGRQIDQAADFIVSCQKPDGLLSYRAVRRNINGTEAAYNHGIAGVALSELYGMTNEHRNQRLARAIERALVFTAQLQDQPKAVAHAEGAWRYVLPGPDRVSDLSVTSWQLMFYRSAKSAGFDIPSERIDRAMRFVVSCLDRREGTFRYHPTTRSPATRAMAGAGIVALAHGGMFDHEMAQTAGDWLLKHPYTRYLAGPDNHGDYFHYGVFYSSAGMYMLGGRYWRQFFPQMVGTMLRHQNRDGSWQPERGGEFGNVYTTALVVIGMNVPNQFLPILQR